MGGNICSLKALTKFTLHNHRWRGHMTWPQKKLDSPSSNGHLALLTPDILHCFAGCCCCTVLFIFAAWATSIFSKSAHVLFIAEFLRKASRVLSPVYKKNLGGHFEHSRASVWKHRDLSRILFFPCVSDLQFAPAVYQDSSILEHKQELPTSHSLSVVKTLGSNCVITICNLLIFPSAC